MLSPDETKKRQDVILEMQRKLKDEAKEDEKNKELAKAILGLILVASTPVRRKKRWWEYL